MNENAAAAPSSTPPLCPSPRCALDCVIARTGTHSYTFILFCSVEEARAAIDVLQGTKVKGAAIRNEFSRNNVLRSKRSLRSLAAAVSLSITLTAVFFYAFGSLVGEANGQDVGGDGGDGGRDGVGGVDGMGRGWVPPALGRHPRAVCGAVNSGGVVGGGAELRRLMLVLFIHERGQRIELIKPVH